MIKIACSVLIGRVVAIAGLKGLHRFIKLVQTTLANAFTIEQNTDFRAIKRLQVWHARGLVKHRKRLRPLILIHALERICHQHIKAFTLRMRERRSDHGQGAGTEKINSVERGEFHGGKFWELFLVVFFQCC